MVSAAALWFTLRIKSGAFEGHCRKLRLLGTVDAVSLRYILCVGRKRGQVSLPLGVGSLLARVDEDSKEKRGPGRNQGDEDNGLDPDRESQTRSFLRAGIGHEYP